MKQEFMFNRKYIKAAERNKTKYSWDKVLKDFYKILKDVPVQKSEKYYTEKPTGKEWPYDTKITHVCKNLYQQMKFVLEWYLDDCYGDPSKDFLLPYTNMFFLMKDYSDDELSYLYTTGLEFINTFTDDIEPPRDLISEAYTQNIKRSKVISVVAFFLALKVIIAENDGEYGEDFSLEEYEAECGG